MGGTHKQRQEQEPARTDVTEVGSGVLRMQLPISMPGLGHVNMYGLVDDRGIAIVDPGLPGPASWKAITDRLKHAGFKVRDVHTVIITHSHPDHFGGVSRLVEESGATDVVTHSAFRSWWTPHTHEDLADDIVIHDVDPEDLPQPRQPGQGRGANPWGGGQQTPWGSRSTNMKPPLRRRLQYRLLGSRMARRGMQRFGPPTPTVRLKHGDVIKLAGREWFAVHTPGHTLDHLCLHDPEGGVVLSGDHVLPSITPHISGTGSGRDPLALFFDSLDRVAALQGVEKVLPAHGHPFDDMVGRVEAIKDHHAERLEKLRSVSNELGRPASVEEFSQHLFRKERWGSMAESETYAHLEHLRFAGAAERHDEAGVLFYEIAAS